MKEKFFVSWSGGKDSYLALLKAKEQGLDIQYLLNFTGHDGRGISHGISYQLLKQQAGALGIPLVTEQVSWESYEAGFIKAVTGLKKEGITGGVFGDINIVGHREWVEEKCGSLGITARFPLWARAEEDVLKELLSCGAQLIIVSIDEKVLPGEWLGKKVDQSFITACQEAGISPCGENGEYHTMVVGGPLFDGITLDEGLVEKFIPPTVAPAKV